MLIGLIILFDRSSGLSFSSLGLRPRLDVQEKGWLTTIVGHDMVRDVFHVGLSLCSFGLRPRLNVQDENVWLKKYRNDMGRDVIHVVRGR